MPAILARGALAASAAGPLLLAFAAAHRGDLSAPGDTLAVLAALLLVVGAGVWLGPRACAGISRAQAGTTTALVALLGFGAFTLYFVFGQDPICAHHRQDFLAAPWSELWLPLGVYGLGATAAVGRQRAFVLAWPLSVALALGVALASLALHGADYCVSYD
jgi:hypothetical protein